MTDKTAPCALPGQDALIASWRAIAADSPGARIIETAESVIAIFPSFTDLNNAIVFAPHDVDLAREAHRVADAYRRAAVQSWALWIPSPALTFEANDAVAPIHGFKRDTTTLIMTARADGRKSTWDATRRASIWAANCAGDEPLSIDALGDPPDGPLDAWVVVAGKRAVAGAWRYLHRRDCGIYAVGTAPRWRRHGIARRLVEHLIADAARLGAQTATLQSTPQAQRLYESIGFTASGRYEEWIPE